MLDMGKSFQQLKNKKDDEKKEKKKLVSPLKDIATKAQKAKAKMQMEQDKKKVYKTKDKLSKMRNRGKKDNKD